MNKWDSFHEYYESKGDEVQKKFPSANIGALTSFRNISISGDSPEARRGDSTRPVTAQGRLMEKLMDSRKPIVKRHFENRISSAHERSLSRPAGDRPTSRQGLMQTARVSQNTALVSGAASPVTLRHTFGRTQATHIVEAKKSMSTPRLRGNKLMMETAGTFRTLLNNRQLMPTYPKAQLSVRQVESKKIYRPRAPIFTSTLQ